MNWNICMRRSLILAIVASFAGAPVLAAEFAISASNGPVDGTLGPDLVSGTLRPVQYWIEANSRVLSVRADVPVICARKGYTPTFGKRLIVDPNGYFQDTTMAYDPPADAPFGADAPLASWVRGSDSALFTTATLVSGGQAPLLFVNGVGAQCVELPVEDTANGTASCTGAVDAPESIFDGQFETAAGEGTLSLSSRVVSATVAWVTYEHVLSAQNGPVADLNLREQFAFASLPNGSGQPVFKHSMAMESAWNCQATEGANCGANERQGLGYIRLDGASLDAGTCLRITATRPRRSDGVAEVPFSGRIFTAAFHKRASAGQWIDAAPLTTRILYAQ